MSDRNQNIIAITFLAAFLILVIPLVLIIMMIECVMGAGYITRR